VARPVQAGDVVTIVKHEADYVRCYGAAAREPFTVEATRRVFGDCRVMCSGGGHAGFPRVRQMRPAGTR
jgi:hypothetical protein